MKKSLTWLLFLVLTLSVAFIGVSCKGAVVAETTASTEETTAVTEETSAATETVAETTEAKKWKVANLWLGTTTPYLMPAINATKKTIQDAGHEYILLDAKFDAALQSTQMDDAIAMGVDIIDLIPLDAPALSAGIKKAYDLGIPVLMDHVKAEPEDEKYTVGYSGPDNYIEGQIAGELMHKALGGKGKVAIIEGVPGAENTINREKGFTDKLKELNSGIEVVATQPASWDKAQAIAIMEDWIVRYPDLNGIYGEDDTLAMGAWKALEEAGYKAGDIVLVGVGGSAEGLNAIKDGIMYGTVLQSPSKAGILAAELSLKILNEGIKPPMQLDPYYNYMDLPPVTKDNVDQYLPGEW
ncbi:MAG: sugar ABC transporter substrate-binding protein [Actinobacteria bacterium]|nr:sugar ABC transporter substrate-binding protein [Actinomycetota bacterium]